MAIVYTTVIKEGPARGATVSIDDSLYGHLSPEEKEKRRQEVIENYRRVLWRQAEAYLPKVWAHLTTKERLEIMKYSEAKNDEKVREYLMRSIDRIKGRTEMPEEVKEELERNAGTPGL